MEKCYFCQRGILEKRRVTVDFRWGTKLTVFENVPAKVCNECGERYYPAEVSRKMERMVKEGKGEREIRVPVVAI